MVESLVVETVDQEDPRWLTRDNQGFFILFDKFLPVGWLFIMVQLS